MSENDSFLSEVSDELRQEKTQKLLRKYGWMVGVIAVGIIGFVGFNEWQTNRENESAGIQYGVARSFESAETVIAEYEALAAPTNTVSFLAADAYVTLGETDKAVAIYDGILATNETPAFWRDAAIVKRAALLGEAVDPLLSNPDKSIRDIAFFTDLDMLLKAGEEDAAKIAIESFLAREEVSEDARQIAEDVMLALGGEIPEPLSDISSEVEPLEEDAVDDEVGS